MRKGGSHVIATDSIETETPQGSNACRDGNKLERKQGNNTRKQYKLLSGLHDRHWIDE